MGIITEYRIEEKYNHNILSVIFDADSFFYGVSDVQGRLMKACKYVYKGDSAEHIPQLILKENLANHYYSSVNLYSSASSFSFIPVTEYSYGMEESVIRNSFDSTGKEIAIDTCSIEQLNVVHGFDEELREAFASLGNNLDIRHISLAYIQAFEEDGIYVNVGLEVTTILVRKQGAFVLYNQYAAMTAEDRLYFVMLAIDQLNLDPRIIPVFVSGVNEECETLRTLLANYVINIKSLNKGFTNIENSSDIMDLYLASICE